jgi:hypothetical protein
MVGSAPGLTCGLPALRFVDTQQRQEGKEEGDTKALGRCGEECQSRNNVEAIPRYVRKVWK